MKQPQAPRQSLVWTPDMDPRLKQKPAPEVEPEPPAPTRVRIATQVSSPVASKPKKIQAATTAPTSIPETVPAAAPAPPPSPEAATAKPKTAKAAKSQKGAEVAAFALEHDISADYARLVLAGTWTLQNAKQRQKRAEVNKERALIREGAILKSEKLLSRWIEEKTDLVRVTDSGTSCGVHLLQIERLDLHWDDQDEPLPKIQSHLIYSQTDSQNWAATWKTDPALQAQGLTIPRRFADRVFIPNWEMERVTQRRRPCTIKFYNGLEITGYIVSWHDYALEMVSSLEDSEAAHIYVFRHAIYEFSAA